MSSVAMEVNSMLSKPAPIGNILGNSGQASSILERTQYYHPSSSGGGGYHHEYHSSYGGGGKGGGKRSIALTALTLLSFLFFLHILENCIQQQNDMMNPQVVIMQARIKAHRRHANKRMTHVSPSEETYVNSSVDSVKNFDKDSGELYYYAKIPEISPTKFN